MVVTPLLNQDLSVCRRLRTHLPGHDAALLSDALYCVSNSSSSLLSLVSAKKFLWNMFPHKKAIVDLWKIHVNSSSLTRTASLSEWIDYPVERGVIIDEYRNLVVIPQCGLLVFGCTISVMDTSSEKVALFGCLSVACVHYDNGRVLVAVDDDETWLLVCNLTESDPNRPRFLTEITGSSLTSEGEERPSGFGPVWLSHAGDVIASPNDALPPPRFTKISRTISVDDDGDGAINMQCATAMSDDRQCWSGDLWMRRSRTREPIFGDLLGIEFDMGHIDVLRHVLSLNVVVAIGYISERQHPVNGDSPDYALTVERVNFRVHRSSVRVCDISTKAAGGKEVVFGRPDLVVIFCDGGVIVKPLEAFIMEGLPRVSESSQVAVSPPFWYNFGKSTHAADMPW
ncbi:hypothetical protein DFS33DRAFT_1275915 [Desarmillaria ectypa]|nr:hypothetical protein DFS33DRAFT_1275915 [Desarmillaria ectypa]